MAKIGDRVIIINNECCNVPSKDEGVIYALKKDKLLMLSTRGDRIKVCEQCVCVLTSKDIKEGSIVMLSNSKCCGAGRKDNLVGIVSAWTRRGYRVTFEDGCNWNVCPSCISLLDDNESDTNNELTFHDYIFGLLITLLVYFILI